MKRNKSIPKGISLPADMWSHLEQRREQEGIPVSTQIQRAVENDIMDRAEAKVLADVPPQHRQTAEEFIAGKPHESFNAATTLIGEEASDGG